MSRIRTALVSAGLLSAGAALTAGGTRQLLRRQAAVARRAIGKPFGEEVLDADRTWKPRYGERLDLLVLGDSIAAGLGAELPRHTLGARLARKLAEQTHRSVRLRTAAFVGAESSMLRLQLDSLPPAYRPDLAIVIVGGNDVTHRVPIAESVRDLGDCLDRLTALGARVVVGTCPDLGALRPVPQPLRALGSLASRHLAAAQREAALAHGAHPVSLADLVGPHFRAAPDEMFSADSFHPSSVGYKRTAKAMLPAVLEELGRGRAACTR